MKQEFASYLNSIDMSSTLIKRAADVFRFYAEICPEEITDIFVSEYVNEEGQREYENLWILSPNYVGEAHNFLDKDDFDLTRIARNVNILRVRKEEYDFTAATHKSRLRLEFLFRIQGQLGAVKGAMKASGRNCDYLKAIVLKYIVPNLRVES